jgi:hypothetical protein
LLRTLQKAAAARLAGRGELPSGASAASDLCASDAEIRQLVARDALPAAALEILDATQPSAGALEPARIDAMVDAAERFVAAIAAAGAAANWKDESVREPRQAA